MEVLSDAEDRRRRRRSLHRAGGGLAGAVRQYLGGDPPLPWQRPLRDLCGETSPFDASTGRRRRAGLRQRPSAHPRRTGAGRWVMGTERGLPLLGAPMYVDLVGPVVDAAPLEGVISNALVRGYSTRCFRILDTMTLRIEVRIFAQRRYIPENRSCNIGHSNTQILHTHPLQRIQSSLNLQRKRWNLHTPQTAYHSQQVASRQRSPRSHTACI